VLLTGFADKENTIRAINELDLFQYLEKPWDNQQLLLVVERGLQQRSLRRQLSSKVKELDEMITEHRDLQERHSTLERELEMAARVQRSLLPETMPDTRGFQFSSFYHPCHEIGGDYYGLKVRDNAAALILADVSGHGVQAALTSMLIKAIFEEVCGGAGDATTLVEEMNAALHRFLPSGMYSAATIAWMSDEEGLVRVVNAGNPYPFILRAAEKRVDEVPVAGMPLGIFGRGGPATFDFKEVQLAPGDVLLLASDGIGDVRGPGKDELFQDEHLREILTGLTGKDGEAVVQELVAKAKAFAGDRPIPDDISMVAVTRSA
jgi:sigma-B regulation protein RsbU (phosphoserine phosphatase)